jgi:hypothetical protein
MQQLSFLLAPVVPMVCFALVLWLDRLEESLDTPRATPAGLDQTPAEPVRSASPAPAPAFAVPAPELAARD